MLKKLKSLFIVEDEKSKAGKKEVDKSTDPKQKVNSHSGGDKSEKHSPKSLGRSSSEPSQKFTDILLGALEANNQEGFDYIEYKESLDSLAKMNMDEATRFKSAFAMAQTMDASPKQLLDSATHYRDVLTNEEQKFLQALENQRNRQINEQEKKIDHYNNEIQSKQKQLEQLKESIEKDKQALLDVQNSVDGAEKKIEETSGKFMASYQAIASQIESDIEKIKKYLK